jgi:hypothetical protein
VKQISDDSRVGETVYMSKGRNQTAIHTILFHDNYVLKSSNISRVKIMVSQRHDEINMDIRNMGM